VFADASGGLFAVWRAALASPREEKEDTAWGRGSLLSAPARLRALRASAGAWLVILARGGHFAAVVVRMCDAPQPRHVVAHRTFHRYVVRAKQGGRQGTKDATGKSIKSAGSALRRANEQALERDIRGLLCGEWKMHCSSADVIWLAVSDTDRRILLGSGSGDDGAPLQKDDARLRRVPFGTRRPTLQEAQRVASLLGSVDLGIAPAADSDGDEPLPQRHVPREAAPAAGGETAMHLASRAGDVATLVQLLASGAEDPCARDARGRTPAQVARNRAVQHAFQRARAAAPEACDWDAAGVGPPLTPAMEAAASERRAAADALRRQAARERRAKQEAEQEKAEAEAVAREARDAAALEAALTGAWSMQCMCVYFCAHITSHTRWRPRAPGARSSAAALLTAAADAQRQAREARAAAAERRLASLGISGGGSRGGDGTAGTSSTRSEPSATTGSEPKTDKVASATRASAVHLGTPPSVGAALARVLQACNSSQAAVLARVLANVASQPGDARYRRLRLSNAKVADAVVATGALAHLLVPCFGWTMEADDEGTPDAVAVQSAEAAEQHAQAMQQCAQRLLQL